MGKNQEPGGIRKYRGADFIICNSCFWCASILSSYYPTKCSSCSGTNVELIPITKSESYAVRIDRKGVDLEFWNIHKLPMKSQEISVRAVAT